ncbi:hypothetical protein HDK90DRAFT_43390 [Phyllosticta capitalensis]|uniref:Tesmin/TSO1-like CXC domain-containing protein n=1 Tax=Phyllosticta capitalensis TaxID=121624 RepID=A0ABR1Z5Z2_9PEZI
MSLPVESSGNASSNLGKRKRTEDSPAWLTQASQSQNASTTQEGERGEAANARPARFTDPTIPLHDSDFVDEFSSDDDFGGGKYDAKAPITETQVEPPSDFKPQCRCKGGKGKQGPCVNCSCSKWGYRCSPETCGCSEACENPFNTLNIEDILGSSPEVKLSPCFISWILKRGYRNHKLELRQITLKWLFDKLHHSARQELEKFNKAFNAWRKDWKKVSKKNDDHPEKVEAMRDLINIAFDEDFAYGDFNGYYFSFCAGGLYGDRLGTWRRDTKSWHCRGCGDCMDWDDWHCRNCNKCSCGGRCDGCGGVCETYHMMNRRSGYDSC